MLLPCTSCQRHVRATNLVCPFCGLRSRLVDATRVISSSLAVAVFVTGCGTESAPPPPPATTAPTPTVVEPVANEPAPVVAPAIEAAPGEPTEAAPTEPAPSEPVIAPAETPSEEPAEPPPRRVRRPTPPPSMDPDPRPIAAYGGPPRPPRPDPNDPLIE